MATNAEEVVIGLSRCLVRALDKWPAPREVHMLLSDLKFQIVELDDERRSMNKGTWRHKVDEAEHSNGSSVPYKLRQHKEKEYVMEPTKIVEPESQVVQIVKAELGGTPTEVCERFLRSLKITTQGRRAARLVISGLSNFASASLLGITEKSFKHHVDAVYKVLDISSRAQLCSMAFGYDVDAACKLNEADPLSESEIRKYAMNAKRGQSEVHLGI
jgi:DNA-binding CsgD family transcriptional regulator